MQITKRTISTYTAGVCALTLFGATVTPDRAHDVAASFLTQSSRNAASLTLAFDSNDHTPSREADPTYYAFTPVDGKGFVIVAGDDALPPILGYSFEDELIKEIPAPMADWLSMVNEVVIEARNKELKPTAEYSQQWLTSRAGTDIVRHETAKWGQEFPYNMECPFGVTGCVNTARAIVMRFLKWPPAPTGVTEEYDIDGYTVNARDLSQHVYDWESLPLTDASNTANKWTVEQRAQIAMIMADLGHAAQSHYGKETTAVTSYLLPMYEHFYFSANMHTLYKGNFSPEVWTAKVKTEVDKAPVLYDGRPSETLGGHAYVIDGYNDRDYFHVNWGWGGHCDGYYLLTNMVPDGINYGGWATMVMNFIPRTGENEYPNNWLTYNTFERPIGYAYIPTMNVSNPTLMEFEGTLSYAAIDKNGNLKKWLGNIPDFKLQSQNYTEIEIDNLNVDDFEIGDYLAAYYCDNRQNLTKELERTQGIYYFIDQYTIEESTSLAYANTEKKITVDTKPGVVVSLLSPDGSKIEPCSAIEQRAVFVVKELPDGDYRLILEKGKEHKEITITLKPGEK